MICLQKEVDEEVEEVCSCCNVVMLLCDDEAKEAVIDSSLYRQSRSLIPKQVGLTVYFP